MKKFWSTSTFF